MVLWFWLCLWSAPVRTSRECPDSKDSSSRRKKDSLESFTKVGPQGELPKITCNFISRWIIRYVLIIFELSNILGDTQNYHWHTCKWQGSPEVLGYRCQYVSRGYYSYMAISGPHFWGARVQSRSFALLEIAPGARFVAHLMISNLHSWLLKCWKTKHFW